MRGGRVERRRVEQMEMEMGMGTLKTGAAVYLSIKYFPSHFAVAM